MVQSMTGFGRSEANSAGHQVMVEIKSVNHRFKDFRFKIPNSLNSQEILLKQKLSACFKRGSLDIYIRFKKSSEWSLFEDLDQDKIKSYLNSLKKFLESTKENGVQTHLTISPQDFLRSEFYKEQDSTLSEDLLIPLNTAFEAAIEELKDSRLKEGEKLVVVIENHLADYLSCFSVIEGLADNFQSQVEEKIRMKLNELSAEVAIDEPRFAQEVIYYLERIDIHEEINRIKAHIDKFKKILSGDLEKGRQIDFLLQELNRETNTIGSKSNITKISENIIQMKLHLEKMREQALNLE